MSRIQRPSGPSRVLGVDFGGRRVGLAVSDSLGLTAQPLATLEVSSLADAVAQVAETAREAGVALIVVGYPLLLSGKRGELARRVDRFAAALEETSGLPVKRWDERLTTVEANRLLRHKSEGRRKRRVKPGEADRLAACLLLGSFLERHPPGGSPEHSSL